ncbi:hypothetical protein QL093DRAFT_2233010 [Fusarium oxysporum]|nr:hypothetical protein QL093DRAFT_2233010 [Fusarium oxysporum]
MSHVPCSCNKPMMKHVHSEREPMSISSLSELTICSWKMFEMIVILGGLSIYVRFGFLFQLLQDNERHLGHACMVWWFCSVCGACLQMMVCHSSTKRSFTEEIRE